MMLFAYFCRELRNALLIFSFGVLPWLMLAFLLQAAACSLRKSAAAILGVKCCIWLTAPGVMLHEFSHAFFCLVFRHRITGMRFFAPEPDGTLGYVRHSYNPKSFYQRTGNFFIGTSPVWGGLLMLYVASSLLLPAEMLAFGKNLTDNVCCFGSGLVHTRAWESWRFYLWIYIVFSICTHLTLSRPDLVGAADGLLMICGLILFACLGFGWYGGWTDTVIGWLKHFLCSQLVLAAAAFCLLLPAVLILRLFSVWKGVREK